MMPNLPQTRQRTLAAFVDKIYDFYFVEHTKQILLSAGVLVLMICYMAVNVFLLRRSEQTALSEAVWLIIVLSVLCPVLYCGARTKQPRDTTHDVVIFDAMFYRKTPRRVVRWKTPPRQRYRKGRAPHVIYKTDAYRHSNLFCD